MLLIDCHLDLAMNALQWNRNLELSVAEIRQLEADMTQKGRGCGTVSLPELRRGDVGLSVVTVIARTARPNSPASGAATQEISYAKAQGQPQQAVFKTGPAICDQMQQESQDCCWIGQLVRYALKPQVGHRRGDHDRSAGRHREPTDCAAAGRVNHVALQSHHPPQQIESGLMVRVA